MYVYIAISSHSCGSLLRWILPSLRPSSLSTSSSSTAALPHPPPPTPLLPDFSERYSMSPCLRECVVCVVCVVCVYVYVRACVRACVCVCVCVCVISTLYPLVLSNSTLDLQFPPLSPLPPPFKIPDGNLLQLLLEVRVCEFISVTLGTE